MTDEGGTPMVDTMTLAEYARDRCRQQEARREAQRAEQAERDRVRGPTMTRIMLAAGIALIAAGLVETTAAVGYGYPGALTMAVQAVFMVMVARTVTGQGAVS